ncbi:MAG: hypothetical protein ACUVS5_11095, partial [Anaerolineae bacterium]
VQGGPLAEGPLFRCPACGHAPLEEAPEACYCAGCGRAWPVEDGLYLFRDWQDEPQRTWRAREQEGEPRRHP